MNYLNKGYPSINNNKNDLPLYIFLLIGVVFRLFHFFYNRSLWIDEIYLSASLVKMNYLELLTSPLYYQQKAPLGFLVLVKFMIKQFGDKEEYLRTVPLISGLASMYFFIPVSKYFLNKWGTYVAMAILCFSPALIYHSVEIKQYSTELLGTMLSLYIFIRYHKKTNKKKLFFWGISGAVILWFSYSSVFILAGIAMGLSLQYLIKRKWQELFSSMIPFFMWLLSFCVNYILFTHKHAESEWIAYWFRTYGNFMPVMPKSLSDFAWFPMTFYRMLDYPLGMLWNFNSFSENRSLNMLLKMPFIGIGLFFTGIYILFKRSKSHFLILTPPIALTLFASGLELYPLTERFWVFISPIFIIIIASGFQYLTTNISTKSGTLLLFLLVVAAPLFQAISYVIKPERFYVHKKSFQREALMFVNNNIKKGDIVYIYWNNLPGYRLYKRMYHFRFTAIEGQDVRNRSSDFNNYYFNLKPDFDKLTKAKRIWLVYNTRFITDIGDKIDEPVWYYQNSINPTDSLQKEFRKLGNPIKKYATSDVSVYLFNPNVRTNQKI